MTSWVRLDEAPDASALPIPDERIGVKLYELSGVQPRAFVTRRVRSAADAHEALARFVTGDGGAHTGLALVRRGDLPAAAFADPPVADPATAADVGDPAPRFLRDGRSALEIEAVLDAPALLVVNDTMLDGWTATVDGTAAPIAEVNGLVRGVWLDAGTHRVAMRYVRRASRRVSRSRAPRCWSRA